jgi:hypothetical protein
VSGEIVAVGFLQTAKRQRTRDTRDKRNQNNGKGVRQEEELTNARDFLCVYT